MKFKIEQLGIVEQANIELDGLTVLTGLNDTGKSFIGKTIYSIIKTLNKAFNDYYIEKAQTIQSNIESIFTTFRKVVPLTPDITSRLNPNVLNNRIFGELVGKDPNKSEIKEIVSKFKENLIGILEERKARVSSAEVIEETRISINKKFDEIMSFIDEEATSTQKYTAYFNKVITGLFSNQINSLVEGKAEAKISVSEGVSELLSIGINSNRVSNFDLSSPLFLNDCIVIETPTILNLERFITNTLAYKNFFPFQSALPDHYIDLCEKLSSGVIQFQSYKNIYNKISEIIGGQVVYDKDAGTIVFNKNGNKIYPNNIANGIKSFGLLQLLLDAGAINKNSLLIIDEPEVHLHPKWEVQYAGLIVELSNLGIPIVISSHSPYLIESILKYSSIKQVKSKVKFYFGEKAENGFTNFVDVTSDTTPIFTALADPFRTLNTLR